MQGVAFLIIGLFATIMLILGGLIMTSGGWGSARNDYKVNTKPDLTIRKNSARSRHRRRRARRSRGEPIAPEDEP